MGIHYDYKSKRGERAMLKQAKRKNVVEEQSSAPIMHDILKPITLEDLTNPDNKK